MKDYTDKIKESLRSDERLTDSFYARTVPTNPILILFPEVSWATTENMSIIVSLTDKRIIIYKENINDISFSFDIMINDIKSWHIKKGILFNYLTIIDCKNKKIKIQFRKEQTDKIKNNLENIIKNN